MNILRKHRKSNKKNKLKKYILFIFSLIMTTFAWLTYSKVLNGNLNIHVAAWDMEYYIGDEKKENPIGITIPTLYPQMPEQTIKVDIKNNGEALVDIDYHIQSISIAGVDYELVSEGNQNTTENYINIPNSTLETDPETGVLVAKGKIIDDATRFPFTVELEHSLQVVAKDKGYLTLKVKWNGDNDELDSEWGYKVGKYFADNPTATSAMSITLSIDSYQADSEIQGGVGNLPTGPGTRPYLPSSDFTQVEGTDLDTGLVIKDSSGNEYVWIEVPKLASVYPKAGISITEFPDDEYVKIEKDLQSYVSTYRNEITSSDTYNSDDTTGLTNSEYNTLKKKMLKSVYQNGGFYIARYEAGIDNKRTNHASISGLTPKSQANKYPLNWVTCSEAQTLASKASVNGHSGSLMFGIQWDLVQKYIEAKAVTQGTAIGTIQSQLITNSTSWGNYSSSKYNITNENAQYSMNNGTTWLPSPLDKTSTEDILLTTKASNSFAKQNIFDLAGNVWEWTLEYSSKASTPCTIRGGSYDSTLAESKANYRNNGNTTFSYYSVGFRVTIY